MKPTLLKGLKTRTRPVDPTLKHYIGFKIGLSDIKKLVAIANARGLNASATIRALIREAKVKQ
jgi:hypothetical protein